MVAVGRKGTPAALNMDWIVELLGRADAGCWCCCWVLSSSWSSEAGDDVAAEVALLFSSATYLGDGWASMFLCTLSTTLAVEDV